MEIERQLWSKLSPFPMMIKASVIVHQEQVETVDLILILDEKKIHRAPISSLRLQRTSVRTRTPISWLLTLEENWKSLPRAASHSSAYPDPIYLPVLCLTAFSSHIILSSLLSSAISSATGCLNSCWKGQSAYIGQMIMGGLYLYPSPHGRPWLAHCFVIPTLIWELLFYFQLSLQ